MEIKLLGLIWSDSLYIRMFSTNQKSRKARKMIGFADDFIVITVH